MSSPKGKRIQAAANSAESGEQHSRPTSALSSISSLAPKDSSGNICVRISNIGPSLTSRNGWKYRKIRIYDKSMNGEVLISDEKYKEWEFEPGDCMICNVRSSGVDSSGIPTFFFNDFVGPFESAEIMYELSSKLLEWTQKSGEHMHSNETVYQISAREAKSLLVLIKLWIQENGKPQHYTKWCQMHQIVATNLYYLGLVQRTASMSGYYYPTEEALDFFSGRKKDFPKRKVFVRGTRGEHLLVSDEGERKTFAEYLSDYSDREGALKEYSEAISAYHEKLRERPALMKPRSEEETSEKYGPDSS